MDFNDFHLKYNKHFDTFKKSLRFPEIRQDFLLEYKRAYYSDFLKESNNPCFILFCIVQMMAEGKKSEVLVLLNSLNGDFSELFDGWNMDSEFTYSIIVCSKDVNDNNENVVYNNLNLVFSANTFFSRNNDIETIKKQLFNEEKSVLILLGHGNDDEGIQIESNEDINYFIKDDICNLPKLSCYMFLSCAYESMKKVECFKNLNNVILANNNIGPTQQVAFTSFFCKALDIGLDLRTSFILAEIGCSTYFYTITGTELYVDGKLREKFNFL